MSLNSSAIVVGTVTEITGIVQAIDTLGVPRILNKGDAVHAFERIVTSDQGSILIDIGANATFATPQLSLGKDTSMVLDDDVVPGLSSLEGIDQDASVDVASIQEAVLKGLFDSLEKTAAGIEDLLSSSISSDLDLVQSGSQGEVTSGYETSFNNSATIVNRSFDGQMLNDRPVFNMGTDLVVDEAAGTVTFTVTKTGNTTQASSVEFTTVDGTAIAGSDYTAQTGRLEFAAGETTKTIAVFITNDAVFEGSEHFSVEISNPSNAILGDTVQIVTVKDDGSINGDDRPVVSINAMTVTEGQEAIFTVSLSNESVFPVSFIPVVASNTAIVADDVLETLSYSLDGGASWITVAAGSGIEIPAGQTSVLLKVQTVDDASVEGQEDYYINLTQITNAANTSASGVGGITDNDASTAESSGAIAGGGTQEWQIAQNDTLVFDGSVAGKVLAVPASIDDAQLVLITPTNATLAIGSAPANVIVDMDSYEPSIVIMNDGLDSEQFKAAVNDLLATLEMTTDSTASLGANGANLNITYYDETGADIDPAFNATFEVLPQGSVIGDPLILDLDGDGIETIALGTTQFDMNADGVADNTGWVGADDALLVRDLNNDGQINNATELFGDQTIIDEQGTKASNAYEALSIMDSNQDNVVNAEDSAFNELRAWVDTNSDGIVQEGELKTLTELGITELRVENQHVAQASNGNVIVDESTYLTSEGQEGLTGGVAFAQQSSEGATQTTGIEDPLFGRVAITLRGSDPEGISIDHFTLDSLPANGKLYFDAAMTQEVPVGVAFDNNLVHGTGSNGAAVGTSTLKLYFKPDVNWSGETDFFYRSIDLDGVVSDNALARILITPRADVTPEITLPEETPVFDAVQGVATQIQLGNISASIAHTPDIDGSEMLSVALDLSDYPGSTISINGEEVTPYNGLHYIPVAELDNATLSINAIGQINIKVYAANLDTATTGLNSKINTAFFTAQIEADPAVASINNVTLPEGDDAQFTVTLTGETYRDTTLHLKLDSGTALLGEDTTGEVLINGQVVSVNADGSFSYVASAGVTSFVVSIKTVDDVVYEPAENFTLSAGVGAQPPVVGTATITDNDVNTVVAQDDFGFHADALGEVVVNPFVSGASQSGSSVAGLVDGSYVVAWTEASGSTYYGAIVDQEGNADWAYRQNYDVFMQRYDSNSEAIGDPVRINTFVGNVNEDGGRAQYDVNLVGLNNGNLLATWTSDDHYIEEDNYDNGSRYIQGQIFDANGSPICEEFTVARAEYDPIAALPDGGFIVTWSADARFDNTDLGNTTDNPIHSDIHDDSGYGVIAQRFDAYGNEVGERVIVNSFTSGNQVDSDIVMIDNDTAIMTWQSENQDGSGFGIYAQTLELTANGLEKSGNEIAINVTTNGDQTNPEITALNDGTAVIVWENAEGIVLRTIESNGTMSDEISVASTGDNPAITALANGFVITWQSGEDIYAQSYNSAGEPQNLPGLVNITATGAQIEPVITALSEGGYVIAYQSDNGIVHQRFTAEGQPFTQTAFAVDEDSSITLDVAELLANDSDPEGHIFSITSVQDAVNGTVTFDVDAGTITFTPNANYNGPATFDYTITDELGATDTATVHLIVKAQGEPTVFVGATCDADIHGLNVTVNEGEDVVFGVRLSGIEPSTTITLALQDGTALDNDYHDQVFQYSFNGTDWFDVTGAIAIPDGAAGLYVKTDTIDNVYGESTEEFALTATLSTGQTATGTATILDDVDETTLSLSVATQVNEGEQITYTATVNHAPQTDLIITLSNGAQITIAANQTSGSVSVLSRVDDALATGDTSVTVSVADVQGGNYEQLNATASVTTLIKDDDTAPEATQGTVITCEDTLYTFKVADFNFTDADGDAMVAVRIDSLPVAGQLWLNGNPVSKGASIATQDIADGKLTFTPNTNESGRDEYDSMGLGDQLNDYANFNFSVSDGANWSVSSSTMTIDVTPVADTPDLSILGSVSKTITIDVANVNEGNGAFVVKAYAADGSLTTLSTVTGTNHDGFGVSAMTSGGQNQGAAVEIGYDVNAAKSEVLAFEFNQDLTQIDVAFAWKHSNYNYNGYEGETAVISFYKDGQLVGSTTHNGGTDTVDGPFSFQPDNAAVFDEVRFSSLGEGDDYLIHQLSFTQVNESAVELTTELGSTVDLAINAALTDTDGSERFDALQVSNIPVGVTLTDGTHSFTATSGDTLVNVLDWDLDAIQLHIPTYLEGHIDLTITAMVEESLADQMTTGESCPLTAVAQTSYSIQVARADATLTLNDVTVNEGSETAQMTASLDYTPHTELVVTLSNGATITFGTDYVPGVVVSSTPFSIHNGEDAYLDASSFNVTVISSTGGNFANLVSTDTATITVSDTIDTTTLTLNDVTVSEGTGQAQITASLDHAPQTELVVTLNNGATITFGTDYVAGTNVSSTAFDINNGEDVYADGSSFELSVASTSGGNFENLVSTDVATVTVSDTVATTTVTLNDVTVNEGTGTVSISASLDHTPETELVVTLSNGATITFGTDYVPGQSVNSTSFSVQVDDVYVDSTTDTISIASTTGGNFESLDVSDTATFMINDTLDAAILTLNNVTVSEGTGQAQITASLDHAPQTELVVTLNNGATITFGTDYVAGTNVSSTAFDINNGEDVYADGSSFELSVASTSGGNFENLVSTDTATVTVSDTIDTSTVTLSAASSVTEGDAIVYTATVNNAPQTDLQVVLSNNQTITIAAGQLTGTVTQATQNDHIHTGDSTVTVSIVSTTGGNYEHLALNNTPVITTIVDDEENTVTAVADVASVIEDGSLVATGNVLTNDSDIDGDSFQVSTVGTYVGTYGTLVIAEDGAYTYTLNNDSPAVQALDSGEQVSETFVYALLDARGATDSASLVITVVGADEPNQPPVLSCDSANAYQTGQLFAEYFGVNEQIDSLTQFRGIVENNTPAATFMATDISYGEVGVTTDGNGQSMSNANKDVATGTSLQLFLDADAASLSNDPSDTTDGGIHITGLVYLEAGTYSFKVLADDGYDIQIDGVSVATYENNQSPAARTHDAFTVTSSGYHEVDMVWWDQGGAYIFDVDLSKDGGAYLDFTTQNFTFATQTSNACVLETLEDTPITITESQILAHATDANGDSVSVNSVVVDGQTIQAVVIDGERTWTFNPTANTDVDSVMQVNVIDSHGAVSNMVEIPVSVLAVADAPTVAIHIGEATEVTTTVVGEICATAQDLGDVIAYVQGQNVIDANQLVALSQQDAYNLQLSSLGDGDAFVYDNPNNTNAERDINDLELSGGTAFDVSGATVISDTVNNTYQMTSNQVIFEGNLVQNGNVHGTSGDDVIIVKGEMQGGSNVNAGSGNDVIALFGDIGANQPAINGDSGFDILYLSKPASSYYFSDIHFHDNLDGHLVDKDTGQTLTFNNIEGIAFGDGSGLNCNVQGGVTTTTHQEYPVDVSAALADIDGSESLTVTISGVPDEATLSAGTKNSDGTWSLEVPAGATEMTQSLTLTLPDNYGGGFSLTATAKATETNDNDDGQNYAVSSAVAEVVDLMPEGANESQTLNFESVEGSVVAQVSTNVIITLDISGSMDDNVTGGTRLDIAKAALENMIATYQGMGSVNVKLVTFSSSGTAYNWMTAEQAISAINNLDANGYTNYEDAVYKTYNNYSEPDADRTIAYFISDGEPTRENSDGGSASSAGSYLDQGYVTGWNTFVDSYVDSLHVVAVGSGISNTAYLDVLADAGDVETTIVVDERDLEAVLAPAADQTVSGNVLDNVTGGDGQVVIQSINVDGVTYTAANFPNGGLALAGDGTLLFNFATGDYSYTANGVEFTQDQSKVFSVTAADADGDSTTYQVTIVVNMDDTASAPQLTLSIGDVEVQTPTGSLDEKSDFISSATHQYYDFNGWVNFNDQANQVDVQDDVVAWLDTKEGHDAIWVADDVKNGGGIDAGAGDDKVYIGDYVDGTIKLGSGNDYLVVNGRVDKDCGWLDGESGTDSLVLKAYTLADYNDNKDDIKYSFTNFENVMLGDGTIIMGSASAFTGNAVPTYVYGLDISASLADQDGSETLAQYVVINNLPEDGSATINGTGVSTNADGSYRVALQQDGTVASDVSISSTRELTTDELAQVHASVTSTEENGGDTATTEVNEADDHFLYGADGDDLFIGSGSVVEHFVVDDNGSTTIQGFDFAQDILDISDVIDSGEAVDSSSLAQYLNFAFVDEDNDGTTEGVNINIDADGDTSTSHDVTTVYLDHSGVSQHDIDDMKVDYTDQ